MGLPLGKNLQISVGVFHVFLPRSRGGCLLCVYVILVFCNFRNVTLCQLAIHFKARLNKALDL